MMMMMMTRCGVIHLQLAQKLNKAHNSLQKKLII